MHEYLRAIGFSEFKDNHEVDNFISENLDERYLVSSYSMDNNIINGQFKIPVAPSIFLSVVGEQNDKKQFAKEYYFPQVNGYDPVILQECTVQRHSEKETFAGIIDDNKLGTAIIFFVTNPNQYLSIVKANKPEDIKIFKTYLSALCIKGTVILPIEKKLSINYDTDDEPNYSNRKYKRDDVYSFVDNSFIPYGIECDKYQILGEILSVNQKVNAYTDEIIYEMRIQTMGYVFPVCINSKDIVGDPQPGRRFKGIIWLLGEIEFQAK